MIRSGCYAIAGWVALTLLLVACRGKAPAGASIAPSTHDVGEELGRGLDSLLEQAVRAPLVPGVVLSVMMDGEHIYSQAMGHAQLFSYGPDRLAQPEPMTTAHRFDLASLTKVFATTMGVMLLVDADKLVLDQSLRHYLPDFSGPAKDSITVRHLLTHTAGLHPWKPTYYHASDPSEAYQYIRELGLAYPVGRERHYSDLGFMLLGHLIEVVSGQPLPHFLHDHLYEVLDLRHTSYVPTSAGPPFAATSHGNPFERRMVADDDFGYRCDEDPLSFDGWRRYTLVGEVNDGNAFHAFQGVAGHAGLFSTADELQVLLQVLLQAGTYGDHTIFDPGTIDTFLTPDRFGQGLGWLMSADLLPIDDLPAGAFGHTGFTGTFALAVPSKKLSIVLLTNRQNLGVNADGFYNSVTALRREVSRWVLDHLP